MKPGIKLKKIIPVSALVFGIWFLFFSSNVKASGYSGISEGSSVHMYTGTYEVSRNNEGEYKKVVYADTGGSKVVKSNDGVELSNWDKEFVYIDQVGSTSFNLDNNGEITEEFKNGNDINKLRYFAYGSTINSIDTSNLVTEDTYTGQKQDSEIDLMYYNARYYDPVRGRFIQADSVNDGLNRYMYVSGNPVNANDPSGQLTCGTLCAFLQDFQYSVEDIWHDLNYIKNSDTYSVSIDHKGDFEQETVNAIDMLQGNIKYHMAALAAKYSDNQPIKAVADLYGIKSSYTMPGKYLLQYLNSSVSGSYTMDEQDIEIFSNSVNAVSIISDLDKARKYDILMTLNYLQPGEIKTLTFDEKFSSTPYTNSDEELNKSLGTLTYKVRGTMSFSLDENNNPIVDLSAEIYSLYDKYDFHMYNYRDANGEILGQNLYKEDVTPYILQLIGAATPYEIFSPSDLSIYIKERDRLFYYKESN